MKKHFLRLQTMKYLFHAMLVVLLFACHDTRSFENVRKLKCGMTIMEVENSMGDPLIYDYINDSTEMRRYVYDNVGNGYDKYLEVTYENGMSVQIKDIW